MIFGFVNVKGGVGKSKLNGYIATYAAVKLGMKVLFLDADVSQLTSREYDVDVPEGVVLDILEYDPEYGNLDKLLEDIRSSYDLIVVDFPGNIQQSGILAGMAMLDYAIIPTTPEPEDVGGSTRTAEILQELGRPFNYMMNNYEVQYYGMGLAEKNGFDEFNNSSVFGGLLLTKGIRKERSLLNQNYVIGHYGGHKNTERVEVVLELVFSKMKENGK